MNSTQKPTFFKQQNQKAVKYLSVLLVAMLLMTGCVYPLNIMFSAHDEALYKTNDGGNVAAFPGITDSGYGSSLPDYGDPSLNTLFDVAIEYWSEQSDPNSEQLSGGQRITISGDYDLLPTGSNGEPCIRLPVIMQLEDDSYNFATHIFTHSIEVDGQMLTVSSENITKDDRASQFQYFGFFVDFVPESTGNTHTFAIKYYDGGGALVPERGGELTAVFVNTSATNPRSRHRDDDVNFSWEEYFAATTVQPLPVTLEEVMTVYRQALEGTEGERVTVALSGWYSELPLHVQQALAEQAQKDGKVAALQIDQVQNGTIAARLTIDPTQAERDIALALSCTNAAAREKTGWFKWWFANDLFVVASGESDGYGQAVELAIKADFSEMSSQNLRLYRFDEETHIYKQLENAQHWVDSNGYLHFTTEYGGTIVVSDGALIAK